MKKDGIVDLMRMMIDRKLLLLIGQASYGEVLELSSVYFHMSS